MTGNRVTSNGTWRNSADCAFKDARLWDLDSPDFLIARGEAVCAACPVVDECLLDALYFGDTGVLRGGRRLAEKRCSYCGGPFATRWAVRYCSRSCQQAWARRNSIDKANAVAASAARTLVAA